MNGIGATGMTPIGSCVATRSWRRSRSRPPAGLPLGVKDRDACCSWRTAQRRSRAGLARPAALVAEFPRGGVIRQDGQPGAGPDRIDVRPPKSAPPPPPRRATPPLVAISRWGGRSSIPGMSVLARQRCHLSDRPPLSRAPISRRRGASTRCGSARLAGADASAQFEPVRIALGIEVAHRQLEWAAGRIEVEPVDP